MQSEPTPSAERRELAVQLGVAETVTTTEAAALLGLRPQSLFRWSCNGTGPIRPVRVGGRIRWRVADIRNLLNGGTPVQPSSHASPLAPVAP